MSDVDLTIQVTADVQGAKRGLDEVKEAARRTAEAVQAAGGGGRGRVKRKKTQCPRGPAGLLGRCTLYGGRGWK